MEAGVERPAREDCHEDGTDDEEKSGEVSSARVRGGHAATGLRVFDGVGTDRSDRASTGWFRRQARGLKGLMP
jgi:hypothetical protein